MLEQFNDLFPSEAEFADKMKLDFDKTYAMESKRRVISSIIMRYIRLSVVSEHSCSHLNGPIFCSVQHFHINYICSQSSQ